MIKGKRLLKEITWFLCTCAIGLSLFFSLLRLLNIEITLAVIVIGAISALLAMYIVRLTVWIFNQNM